MYNIVLEQAGRMISKAQIKYIQSLKTTRLRRKHESFVVEGEKMTLELLKSSIKVRAIFGLPAWAEQFEYEIGEREFVETDERSLKQVSEFKTPQPVLAVAEIPDMKIPGKLPSEWFLALESIRDPGNLGTIIRSADWFGINDVFCSPDCVDVWNPKVVQASMGSVFRVRVHCLDLAHLFLSNTHLPVLAATTQGHDIYETELPKSGIVLVGNESNGLSENLVSSFDVHEISIPGSGQAESLNVAIAASILISIVKKP